MVEALVLLSSVATPMNIDLKKTKLDTKGLSLYFTFNDFLLISNLTFVHNLSFLFAGLIRVAVTFILLLIKETAIYFVVLVPNTFADDPKPSLILYVCIYEEILYIFLKFR